MCEEHHPGKQEYPGRATELNIEHFQGIPSPMSELKMLGFNDLERVQAKTGLHFF